MEFALATTLVQTATLGKVASSRARAAHTFQTVQALRAVAALLVVLDHALDMWIGRINPGGATPWSNGAAGVDIFFIISGFVMVVSSQRLQGEPGAWWTFMRHRIVRIVPLYWLMTTVKLVLVFAFAGLALRSSLDPDFVVRSYLLLPLIDSAGHFRPLLPVGWTLTYEFVFYILFSLALVLRAGVLKVVGPVFAVFALLALMRTSQWSVSTILFDTVVLEFLGGVVLGRLALKRWKMSPGFATASLVLGFVLILTAPQISENMRPLMWGVPAFAIVAGAISLEDYLAAWLPRPLLGLGDASYSIYLTHGFVVPAIGVGMATRHWTGFTTEGFTIVVSLVVAAAFGWLCFIHIERPMTQWLKKHLA